MPRKGRHHDSLWWWRGNHCRTSCGTRWAGSPQPLPEPYSHQTHTFHSLTGVAALVIKDVSYTLPMGKGWWELVRDGTGHPQYPCYPQDGELLEESSHLSFVYEDNECSLVVLGAAEPDSGVYTCTAKNLAGEVSCKAELVVRAGMADWFPSP